LLTRMPSSTQHMCAVQTEPNAGADLISDYVKHELKQAESQRWRLSY
jgi:hypothetical protein